MSRARLAVEVLVLSVPMMVASCSDSEDDGGGSTTGAGGTGVGGSQGAEGGEGGLGVEGDWMCGEHGDVCDCLHGIAIANADPVPACTPSCCGLYEQGTADEFCQCQEDPTNPNLGYASCDEYIAMEHEAPGTKVTICPPE